MSYSARMASHRTAFPILIDFAEAEFQLTLAQPTIAALVEIGELETVRVDDRVLITWDSLTAFAKRLKLRKELQTKTVARRRRGNTAVTE